MGDFDSMTNAQLKEECAKRGLPVSGTNPELVARLEEYDSDPLLSGEQQPKADVATVTETATVDRAPEVDRRHTPSVFRTRFECPGELSTGVHDDNLRRVWAEAVAAGHTPRGGAFGASRTGFEFDGGRRYAVYEINIRRS